MSDLSKSTPLAKRQKPSAAAQLRMLLGLVFILTIAGGAAAYYFSLDYLKDYAQLVNTKVIDSEASAKQVQQLQSLESQLDEENGLIARANDIFATNSNFQAQAIRDVNHYADLAGLNVTTTTFEGENPSPTSRSFIVEIESPAPYQSLIRFLRGVENNIPKMEVTELKVSRTAAGSGGQVNIENVIMVIHVK